jgi:Arm DNA-binding domain
MPLKLHNALTPVTVRNAGPGRHADGGGLYLRVQDGGARSWLYRSIVDGKARDIGIGPAAGAGAIPLADARAMARDLSAQAAKGEALEGKRTKARKAAAQGQAEALTRRTFRDVAEAFIDRKEGGWRNDKHRQQWRNTLATYAYPIIGDVPVSLIGTDHVLKVLEPIWSDKPETASRVRGRIENVLSAAKVQGMRSGENPALWRRQTSTGPPCRSGLWRASHIHGGPSRAGSAGGAGAGVCNPDRRAHGRSDWRDVGRD